MNKNLIALAVAATTLSGAASAASIYQDENNSVNLNTRIQGQYHIEDDTTADGSEDESYVRLYFDGRTQISDTLYGVGYFEKQFDMGSNGADQMRYAYAGLGGDFGLITYGRDRMTNTRITDFTDLGYFWGDAAAGVSENYRHDGVMNYVADLDHLSLGATYRFEDETESDSNNPDGKPDGYGISAIYSFDMGMTLGAAYTIDQDMEDQDSLTLAASYTYGDLYMAGLYNLMQIDGEEDVNGYEFAVAYTIDKTMLQAIYNYADEANSAQSEVDEVSLEAHYKFNNAFRVMAGYRIQNEDDKDDDAYLAVRYAF